MNDVLNLVPSEKEIANIVDDIDVLEGEIFEHTHDNHKSLIVAVSGLTLAKLRENTMIICLRKTSGFTWV